MSKEINKILANNQLVKRIIETKAIKSIIIFPPNYTLSGQLSAISYQLSAKRLPVKDHSLPKNSNYDLVKYKQTESFFCYQKPRLPLGKIVAQLVFA
jgi:hypothetical protein